MPVPTSATRRPGPCSAILALWSVLCLPGPVRAADSKPEAPAVAASGSGPLETEILVEGLVSEERADGTMEKRFVEARRLQAGEEIYYTIRVRNAGKESVTDVVVTKRMPFRRGLRHRFGLQDRTATSSSPPITVRRTRRAANQANTRT